MSNLLQIHEPGETPAPHEKETVVGIDLGTTHSVVSIIRDNQALALEDGNGNSIIKSVVNIEGVEISSIKRLMGRTAGEVKYIAPQLNYLLADNLDGNDIPRLKIGNKVLSPIELSANILRNIKDISENCLGQPISKAVITVPAYFDDAARKATKDAAAIAGLEVMRLINEPTAAALAYGLENNSEGLYAIYDFGGGTFDISLLNLESGVFQVLATGGDLTLGGDDIDRLILNAKSIEVNEANLQKARNAKEKLSETETADIDENNKLTRSELAEIAKPLIERSLRISEQVISDSGIDKNEIQGVVLVGGSTRLKILQEQVEKYFALKPLVNLDPDRVVSYGAATQANQLAHSEGDHLLLDVTPLSLGIETMGGIVEKIIWRNTPTPTSVSQEFTTYKDGQSAMDIHVLQGEREMVKDCRSLARFVLTGIPPMNAGSARIAINFTIDADGMLNVTAEETTTGIKQYVEVKPSYGISLDEMEQMLRDSMINAEDDITERLLREAKVEAERTIQEIKSALKEDSVLLNEKEQKLIYSEIESLQSALYSDDRDLIDIRHQQLQHAVGPFAQKRMDQSIAKALEGKAVEDL